MIFKLATGKAGLGWSPDAFWKSTPDEFWAALEAEEARNEAISEARRGA